MKKAIVFSIVFLLAVGLGSSQKFSLKVSAGLTTVSGGDVAAGIQGLSDLIKDDYGGTAAFGVPKSGLNFSAEFIYHLRPNMGVGIGIGRFSCSKSSTVPYMIEDLHVSHTIEPGVGVVPVTATFHFDPGFSSKIKLDLTAGLGLYFAHFDHGENIEISSRASGTLEYTYASGGKTGFGFHVGVTAEYPLSQKLSLVAGILGRFASVTLAAGNWTETGTGAFGVYSNTGSDHTPWYYDWTAEVAGGKTYPQIIFTKDAPTGSDVANVHAAKLGLGGIVFNAGIRLAIGK